MSLEDKIQSPDLSRINYINTLFHICHEKTISMNIYFMKKQLPFADFFPIMDSFLFIIIALSVLSKNILLSKLLFSCFMRYEI